MEILVISDTHGNINKVIQLLEGDHCFDHIIHLGDLVRDAEDIEHIFGIPMTYVTGNCDYYEPNVFDERVLRICEQNILITHGHNYGVKASLQRLRNIIDEGRANIVLFGHTHKALIEYYGNGILLNPGSIGLPRDGSPSFAVMSLKNSGEVHVKIERIK